MGWWWCALWRLISSGCGKTSSNRSARLAPACHQANAEEYRAFMAIGHGQLCGPVIPIAAIGRIIGIKLDMQAELLAVVLLTRAWIDFDAATVGSKSFDNSIDHDLARVGSEAEDRRLRRGWKIECTRQIAARRDRLQSYKLDGRQPLLRRLDCGNRLIIFGSVARGNDFTA